MKFLKDIRFWLGVGFLGFFLGVIDNPSSWHDLGTLGYIGAFLFFKGFVGMIAVVLWSLIKKLF